VPCGSRKALSRSIRTLRLCYAAAGESGQPTRLPIEWGRKKLDEAIRAFQRNVELYPDSANVTTAWEKVTRTPASLMWRSKTIERAIAQGGLIGDPNLDLYKEHLKRVQAAKQPLTRLLAPSSARLRAARSATFRGK